MERKVREILGKITLGLVGPRRDFEINSEGRGEGFERRSYMICFMT